MTEAPSYHDLYITTSDIPRTSIFNLGYGLRVTCCRVAGWELWCYPDTGGDLILLAGEYAGPARWLALDVNGVVVVDSRRPGVLEYEASVASVS